MSNRFITPEIKHQFFYNLMNMPMRDYPAPHGHIDGIFPGPLFQQLRDYLPDDEVYTGIYQLGRVSNPNHLPDTRFVFSLKDDLDKLEGERRQFWGEVAELFLGDEMLLYVIRRMTPYIIRQHGPDFIKKYRMTIVAELFRDVTEYEIGPHTDVRSRLLNCFFYLPEDDSRPHLGTSFYVPRDPKAIADVTVHNRFEDFIPLYTAPYIPNSMAAFVRTEQSFHGVEPLREEGYKRNVLAYFIRLSEL